MLLSENDRVLTHQKISVLDQTLSQLEAVELKLAGELDVVRSRITSVRNQRAALESGIAAVWSLPNELLSYIFELGVAEQRAAAEADREEKGDVDENGVPRTELGFQVLTAQVCRMFRQVALRTPNLWNQIHVHGLSTTHFDFARTYIERSGSTHLDILIECDLPLDDKNIVDALFPLTETFVPHISRFKRFTARLRGFRALHYIMQTLDQPAPVLETLELSDIDFETTFDEDESFWPQELRKPLTLFKGIVPMLDKVALDGVHVAWSTSNFRGLTVLRLGFHKRDVRPAYEEFSAIIDASPALQTLHLDRSAPLLPEDSAESALYSPILMEQLVELTICDIPSDSVSTLVSLLRAPNLKSLSLTDMDANDYSGLIRTIAGPPALFPMLTALKLATVEVEEAACGDLLQAYPTLTHLSLYMRHMSMTWLDILAPREGSMLCPKLECLRCVGAPTSVIKRVLESRREAGFHIPYLELDEETVAWGSTTSMQWITDNAKVTIIVPSEHGSDDDIDEEESDWGTDEENEGGFPVPFLTMDVDGFSDMDETDENEDEDSQNESYQSVDGEDGSDGEAHEADRSEDSDGHAE